ncbi:hypothetical protein [Saccharopolyspora sp. NPDC002686]|uniref:hypothetical protein n=1 Tax=Saccharopolyspora sp. NPDC002686 TaxID=3154541 RepID=UPI00332BCA19
MNRYLLESTGKRYELDRHQIARYERGEVRWPGAAYRAGFRAVLDAKSDDELGFTPRRQSRTSRRSEGADEQPMGWHPSDVVATAEEMTSQDVNLSRRKALTSAAAVAGAALTGPLQGWLTAQHARFAGCSAISVAELDGWREIAAQLQSWNSTPTGLLARKAVIAQLNDVSDRLKEATDSATTREGFLVGAELAEVAASMSWDSGLHRAAQRYYTLSVQFAKVGGDDIFAAVTLAAFARQCFDLGQPEDGLELVQLAQYGTRRSAPPILRSLLATREAWSYAQTGAVQQFRRAVGLAEDHFGESTADEADHRTRGLDEAELYGVLGARWRDLAAVRQEPKEARYAQEYISRALALRDPSRVRNRAFDLIGLARAHLVTGEPDRACELIDGVLPIAEHWASGRVGEKLRDFHRESRPFVSSTTVRSTRNAVRDLIEI